MKQTNLTTWSRNKIIRTGLIVLAVIAVVVLVLFSEQIGQLLEFFGIRAAIPQQTGSITLIESSEGAVPSYTPFNTGNYIQVDTTFDAQGRIILVQPQQ